MDKPHIGKMIKHLRRIHNETQDELASAIGYTQKAISKIELSPMPPLPVLYAVADHYSEDISVFFPSKSQIPLEYQEFISLLQQVPDEDRLKLLESYKVQTKVLVNNILGEKHE